MEAVHAAAFPPGERWGAAAFATLLVTPGCFGLLDPRGGMALARVAADEAELLTLGVAPDSRRQGVARGLLRAVIAEAASRGAAVLFLEVASTNAAARALYATLGFAEQGRRPGYYPSGGDALVLRRPIAAGS